MTYSWPIRILAILALVYVIMGLAVGIVTGSDYAVLMLAIGFTVWFLVYRLTREKKPKRR